MFFLQLSRINYKLLRIDQLFSLLEFASFSLAFIVRVKRKCKCQWVIIFHQCPRIKRVIVNAYIYQIVRVLREERISSFRKSRDAKP